MNKLNQKIINKIILLYYVWVACGDDACVMDWGAHPYMVSRLLSLLLLNRIWVGDSLSHIKNMGGGA